LISPVVFFWVGSFFIEGLFFMSPFAFLGVAFFSSNVFFDEPLGVFWLPLFLSEVFFL
jgi:hypothetical protein